MELPKSAPSWAFPHPDGPWYGNEPWRAPLTKQCQHGINWTRGISTPNRLLWFPARKDQEGMTCPCMGLCVKHERPNLVPGPKILKRARGTCASCGAPPPPRRSK